MKTQAAIQSFLNNRHAQNLKPKSIQWYEMKLRKFAQCCPKLPTDPARIEGFLISLKGTPETKLTYFKALKVFYLFVTQRHPGRNPMRLIAAPHCPKKVMPTLEPREIMQLLNLADNLRNKALVTVFTDTGARLSEIATLRRGDVKDDTIKVNGKTGEREIPISEETRQLLQALIIANGSGEYIFTTGPDRRPLSRHGIYFIIHSLMTKAGIQGPKLGPHRIRHAFGKNYLVNGGDVRSLQEIMGHASITTTQRYASLNLNDTIAKHHKFTPLRTAHAAAQESFFDTPQAVKEAEAILKEAKHGD